MKKIGNIAGAAGTKLRDRTPSVKLRLLEIDGSHDPMARFVRAG
jgi:hypothetical protein